jgi:hypothetical protein
MKKKNFMVLMMVLAFLVGSVGLVMGDDFSMDATAEDDVAIIYSTSGTVLMLGMEGNDTVLLILDAGTYGASAPGAEVSLSGGYGSVESTGGSLRYTVYGLGNHKITVHTTTGSYTADTLSVQISDGTTDGTGAIVAGGSAENTLGTAATGYVSINSTAASLITGITGTNTWTGTDSGDGAPVQYKLSGNPGVSTVTVIYTIVSEA